MDPTNVFCFVCYKVVTKLDMNITLSIIIFLVGVVALLSGRRLYQVFVGIAGFVFGLVLVDWVTGSQSSWWTLLAGVIIAGVAVFIGRQKERMALRVAGFIMGGFIATFLVIDNSRFLPDGPILFEWLIFVVGGGVGAFLVYRSQDQALIALSSLIGAALIVSATVAAPAFSAALFSGLAATGMLLQSRNWLILPESPNQHRSITHGSRVLPPQN